MHIYYDFETFWIEHFLTKLECITQFKLNNIIKLVLHYPVISKYDNKFTLKLKTRGWI